MGCTTQVDEGTLRVFLLQGLDPFPDQGLGTIFGGMQGTFEVSLGTVMETGLAVAMEVVHKRSRLTVYML
ncbi:hypothetical protein D3C76_1424150 [compost metagenome]